VTTSPNGIFVLLKSTLFCGMLFKVHRLYSGAALEVVDLATDDYVSTDTPVKSTHGGGL
jgi:hypothetical protein